MFERVKSGIPGLDELEDEGSIKILDLESMKGKGVSANMDYILSEVNRIGAKRLVIDSITAFLVACKEEFEYRALMHLFYKILKRSK